MIRLIPFSNGTDAKIWYDNNCSVCRTKCPHKSNIELCFIMGTITLETSEFIRYDSNKTFNELEENDYIRLYQVCQNRHKYNAKKRKSIDNTNEPKLFKLMKYYSHINHAIIAKTDGKTHEFINRHENKTTPEKINPETLKSEFREISAETYKLLKKL